MLRKVLFRALIVVAMLAVAALPAGAAFVPDRIGPMCTSDIDVIQPNDALLPQGSCGSVPPVVSSIKIPSSSVPWFATIQTIEIVVKFRYAVPEGINLMIDPPNTPIPVLPPTPPMPLYRCQAAPMAGDLTWTFYGEVPYLPTNVFGDWNLRASYSGALLPDPEALPKIDWWSMEVIYRYPCTSMAGVVLNKADGAPMAGVEVQLYRNHYNPFPGQWVGKTTTDAAGNFFFSAEVPDVLAWDGFALVAVPPAGFHAAGVSCPYAPDPSPFERGPNAIGVPYWPHNWTGFKFFMEETVVLPVKLSSTFMPTADTYISGWDKPGKTHGNEGGLRIRTGGQEATLMKFDLAGASGTVYKATLQLHANYRSNGVAMKVGAYRLLADWTENAKWGDASFDAAVAGTGKVGKAGGTINVDVTALVQGWMADPTTNFGVYLAGIADGSTEVTVDSSESIYEAFQPKLIVEWD